MKSGESKSKLQNWALSFREPSMFGINCLLMHMYRDIRLKVATKQSTGKKIKMLANVTH